MPDSGGYVTTAAFCIYCGHPHSVSHSCPVLDRIAGAGMEINGAGGRQGANPYYSAGLPPKAVLRVARVLKEGAASHEDDPFPARLEGVTERNWHKIHEVDHLDHLLVHLFKLLTGDTSEDHAGHLATRALMFLEMRLRASGEEP